MSVGKSKAAALLLLSQLQNEAAMAHFTMLQVKIRLNQSFSSFQFNFELFEYYNFHFNHTWNAAFFCRQRVPKVSPHRIYLNK